MYLLCITEDGACTLTTHALGGAPTAPTATCVVLGTFVLSVIKDRGRGWRTEESVGVLRDCMLIIA